MDSVPSGTEARRASRVLIVDDVADNRTVLARWLVRRGLECVQAEDGARALALLAEQDFDLVLLDIVMPGLDGLEVLNRIRRTHSAGALPVIMVTAHPQGEDAVAALTLGANDYISQPLDFAVAQARIQTQLHRKHAEADLQQAIQKLQSARDAAQAANRAKSEFLANMSHEIRTPLNGVLGVASVLASVCSNPEQREMVKLIADSASSLERLLSDVLDIARVETGKLEIRDEVFAIEAVVADAAALFQANAVDKGLGFEILIDDAAKTNVRGDKLRVQQILANLFGNAVKFTQKGSIGCTVSRTPDGLGYGFEVRDTGIGFDAAKAASLFGRFEQADSSITRSFGGSGLGLAISKSLADLMGGSLRAHSSPGEGSVFSLTLPLVDAVEPAAASSPAEACAAPVLPQRARVLLADDHPVNRRVVELILSAAEVDLVCVEDGRQSVDAFIEARFDAVLMDVQMPVMDGLTAIRLIRTHEREKGLPRTPILALSANALPEHFEASLKAGADRHLAKPIVAQQLIAALAEAISPTAEVEGARRQAG